MSHPAINTHVKTETNAYAQFEAGVLDYFKEELTTEPVNIQAQQNRKVTLQDIGFEFAEDYEEWISTEQNPSRDQIKQGLKTTLVGIIASLDEHLIDIDDVNKLIPGVVQFGFADTLINAIRLQP